MENFFSSLWDSQNPLWVILPALAPLVLLASAFVGVRALRNARAGLENAKSADQRQKIHNSFYYIVGQARDRSVMESYEKFRKLTSRLHYEQSPPWGYDEILRTNIKVADRVFKADDILSRLFNEYEVIAIGIERGALDEEIIKDWCRSSYVQDWVDFAPFVREKRTRFNRSKLYCKFEKQALRWATVDEIARL